MTVEQKNNPKIITACDFADISTAISLAEKLSPEKTRLKIGKAMFVRYGIHIVEELQKLGYEIFLDLKFHDIPNTVAEAVSAAADLGIWLLTVHSSGGAKMLAAAADTAAKKQNPPLIAAVTVLTSLSGEELISVGITDSLQNQALRLAKLAYNTGCNAVICSGLEVAAIKQATDRDFLCITPGIRPAGADKNDQIRIATPASAIANGSDYLVIGRPIIQAEDPAAALDAIYAEINASNTPAPQN